MFLEFYLVFSRVSRVPEFWPTARCEKGGSWSCLDDFWLSLVFVGLLRTFMVEGCWLDVEVVQKMDPANVCWIHFSHYVHFVPFGFCFLIIIDYVFVLLVVLEKFVEKSLALDVLVVVAAVSGARSWLLLNSTRTSFFVCVKSNVRAALRKCSIATWLYCFEDRDWAGGEHHWCSNFMWFLTMLVMRFVPDYSTVLRVGFHPFCWIGGTKGLWLDPVLSVYGLSQPNLESPWDGGLGFVIFI